jgi:hypothetical protein
VVATLGAAFVARLSQRPVAIHRAAHGTSSGEHVAVLGAVQRVPNRPVLRVEGSSRKSSALLRSRQGLAKRAADRAISPTSTRPTACQPTSGAGTKRNCLDAQGISGAGGTPGVTVYPAMTAAVDPEETFSPRRRRGSQRDGGLPSFFGQLGSNRQRAIKAGKDSRRRYAASIEKRGMISRPPSLQRLDPLEP